MREITKELEINMSQTESALLSFLESNGGGYDDNRRNDNPYAHKRSVQRHWQHPRQYDSSLLGRGNR